MESNNKYSSFLIKAGYWVVIGGLIVLFIKFLLSPLVPFIIALIVSAIVQPIASFLSKKLRIKKNVLSVFFALLIYLLLAAAVVGILIALISALISWAESMPAFFSQTLAPWLAEKGDGLLAFINRYAPSVTPTVDELLPDALSTVGSSVINFSGKIVSWASSVGSRLPGILLATVICVISTAFMSGDYDHITGAVLDRLPDKSRKIVLRTREALKAVIGRYAKSYFLIFFITFCELLTGLSIVGIRQTFLISLIIAAFDILPIVGSGMVLLPWTIVTFIQGNLLRGIGLAVVYIVIVVARQIIEPKIVGRQVGLHPLLTLVCMWVGLKLAGGVGMFLFPITLLIIRELKADGIISGRSEKAAPENNGSSPLPGEVEKGEITAQ